MPDLADLYPGYASRWIDTSIGKIFARVGGSGPPLLLLHGHPQSNVMWHDTGLPRCGLILLQQQKLTKTLLPKKPAGEAHGKRRLPAAWHRKTRMPERRFPPPGLPK